MNGRQPGRNSKILKDWERGRRLPRKERMGRGGGEAKEVEKERGAME